MNVSYTSAQASAPFLPHLVDRWADSAAEDCAVISPDGTLSYAELRNLSNRMANYLTHEGVKKGARIGVSLPRHPDSVVAILGILKAGAVYVPIDPNLPAERRDFMAEDSGIKLCISESLLRRESARIRSFPSYNPGYIPDGDESAYVIYTSGSTGQPKGVEIAQSSIIDLVTQAEYTKLDSTTRFLHIFSLSSDVAGMEIWTPLIFGGQLVIPGPHLLSCSELQEALVKYEVTDAVFPASLFHRQAEEAPESFASLRSLMVGVEVLNPEHARNVLALSPGLRLVNGYGPTETTVYSTFHVMTAPGEVPSPVPIGRPTPHTIACVVDRNGDVVPQGSAGELCLGGPGLTKGYVNRPELNRERFLQDPLGSGSLLYRTGDLGRWNSDGDLEFLGRIDRQVKIRGYRVEPGEVEARILTHPHVAAVHVTAFEPTATAGEKALVAYCAAVPGSQIDDAELRVYTGEGLPGYMVPAEFVQLESLPLTVTGKVDPGALPLPVKSTSPGPLHSGIEGHLVEIWSRVIGTRDIGLDETFLSLGGDSLGAMHIVAEVFRRFNVKLPIAELIGGATIISMARRVRDPQLPATVSSAPALRREVSQRPAPASYGQHGLWFHDQLHPGSPLYNEVIALRLSGDVAPDALERALTALIRRHEALRTSLVMQKGVLRQIIEDPGFVKLVRIDLPEAAQGTENALEATVRDFVRQPFVLEGGPHLRAALIRVAEKNHVLIISTHHSSMDGWSADVIFDEITQIYTGILESGDEPSLTFPETQYSDFAVWQHELISAGHLRAEVAYWKARLEGLSPYLEIPTDRKRRRDDFSGEGALFRSCLSAEQVNRLDILAKRTGVTRFTALMAALHMVLSHYCGTQDVVVGTAVSGRDEPSVARTVGYFVNMLPIRSEITNTRTFRDLLLRTQQTVSDAYSHQRLPFSMIAEEMGVDSRESTPFVQVCLVPEDVYRHEFSLGETKASFEYFDLKISKFDLTVSLIPHPDGSLGLNAEYRTDLFDQERIEKFLADLLQIIDSAISAPDAPLDGLESCGSGTSFSDVAGMSMTSHGPCTVNEMVDRWVSETPDAVAITCAGESLTYRQFAERSNQLSNYLAEIGVEPGSRVAVSLPRGIDALISFFAVLKNGAAYVPVDPSYPSKRRAYITQNADVIIDITPELLEQNADFIASFPVTPLSVSLRSEDIAHVIYTSGSTGRPKGVEVTHGNVVDLVRGAGYAELTPDSRNLHGASISFDLATFEIWATLGTGASLVVATQSGMTAAQIAELVAEQGLTHAHLPTALFHSRVQEDPRCLAGLHTVMVGGEALSAETAKVALEANPGLRLVHCYGPAEGTVHTTYHVLTESEQVTSPVPIGIPTPNTRIRIVSPEFETVPVGTVGELCIAGPGVAAGYLGLPVTTAERFIYDTQQAGVRYYRTGDMACLNADSTLTFHGRVDSQVKIHGYRVELEEIEAALRSHPSLVEVKVIRREDEPGRPYLAAYYTSRPGVDVDPGHLTAIAAQKLPSYMTPRVHTRLSEFPMTVNGKIDVPALPKPLLEATASRELSCEPQIVQVISGIWREVLSVDVIGIDEPFFDIGGASIQVAQIHHATVSCFPLPEIRIVDLFAHPTIRSYSEHIERLLAEKAASPEIV
ncbi:non-ribosomal peptide synthetase [Streptomyces sp. CB02009]|uniref:non-ribosomal peptide synthetase n=1 Tax=Streptomyces sp. CB02009 TaxID=1703938 RepID=UPI000AEA6B9D|nr:non-ribosomal peptide synthetase [Streptomyces sp. CB02009]